MIELADDHTPQLHRALRWMMQERQDGANLLLRLTEISEDLRKAGLTERERDCLELGMYLGHVLTEESLVEGQQ